jgi:hypothetical protein
MLPALCRAVLKNAPAKPNIQRNCEIIAVHVETYLGVPGVLARLSLP